MKLIGFIVLLICIGNNCFSQTQGRISYKINSQKLTIKQNDGEGRKIFVDVMNNLNKIRDSLQLFLDFQNNESIFYVDEKTNLGLSNVNGYQGVIKSFNFYYKNHKTDVAIEKIVSDNIYLVKTKGHDFDWKITNESKLIDGYKCFKAVTVVSAYTLTKGSHNKTIEAWFCPDIPISLGPLNFGGLPGLILELKDLKVTYYVYNLNFDPDLEIEIQKPSKGKLLSKEEYFMMQPKITRENIAEYIGG